MIVKGKKILVTGGTGFIGKPFIKKLKEEGAEIVCLTRGPSRTDGQVAYISTDLGTLDSDLVAKLFKPEMSFDAAVYLAANIPTSGLATETLLGAKVATLDPFLKFIEYMGHMFPRIVFASSIDVHGPIPEANFSEESALVPSTPYAAAKVACEIYCKYFAYKNNKNYTILRFSQVYGPNEPEIRVIPKIIAATSNNSVFTLKNKGLDKRRFLFVDDAVQGILQALKFDNNDTFILSGSEDIAVADIIRIVQDVTGKSICTTEVGGSATPTHILPNCAKAKTAIDFSPQVSLLEGIQRIIKIHHE